MAEVIGPLEALKKLYRDLAKLVHPDKFHDEAEKARHDILMARVSKAYEAGDEEAPAILETEQDNIGSQPSPEPHLLHYPKG